MFEGVYLFEESSRTPSVTYTSYFELINTSCYIFCNKTVPKAYAVHVVLYEVKNKHQIRSVPF